MIPALFLSAIVLSVAACGGGSEGGGGTNQNPTTPTVIVTPASSSISTAQSLGVTIAVSGVSGTPTGTVVLSSGSYTSSATTLSSGSAAVTIAPGALAAGSATLTAKYTPDSASSASYNGASGSVSVTVTSSVSTPTVTVTPGSGSITSSQSLSVTVAVSASGATPAGSVILSSGSYTSAAATLASGSVSITIPANSLAAGSDTLTAKYTPDSASSGIYNSASGTAGVTVAGNVATTIVPFIQVNGGSWQQINTVSVGSGVTVNLGPGPQASGQTWSWSGPNGFTSSSREIDNIALSTGTNTYSVTLTNSSAATSTETFTITVAQGSLKPTVTVTPEETTHAYAQNLIVTVTVAGGSGTPTGSVTLSSGSFTSASVGLNSGSATFYVQPGSLAQGSDTLTVTYTPDSTSSSIYASSTGTVGMTITAPGSTNIAVNINTLANRHWISPYIYGINSLTESDVTALSPAFVRFGGNEASDYNWKLHTYNTGSDYWFESYPLGNLDSVQFTSFTKSSGSQMLTTMPMLNWVAKQSGYSFSVAKYGQQCQTQPGNSDVGNGQLPDCKTLVVNDPNDAYYPLVDTASNCPAGTTDGTTCLDRETWAQALSAAFGSGTCNVPYSPITSCHFYDMDNEPEIWNGSHRDIHPVQPGYAELSNLFETEGTALKTWDPNAVRFGPITCCYSFLWMAGGGDRGAHAGIDYTPWWLNQINWLDQINGARTLDVFDIHAYFGDNIDTTGYTNPQLRTEVNKYLRTYWDPAYYNSGDDADWITTTQPNRGTTFLIPRVKAMVNAIYPGTPVAFTEWESFFNEWEFATALSDADAYGVMGREGLSFSTRWGGPNATDTNTNQPHPNYTSFKLWTNYDGAKHGFGTLSVSDQSSVSPDVFVSYAALDATGATMTIMVLNKDAGNTADVTFNLNGFNASTYTAYTVASTNPGAITTSASTGWSPTQNFAANSITLLVVSGTQTSQPASEWNLNPDDLMIPASGTGILNPKIVSGTANVTLSSAVFDAFEGATACTGTLTLTNPTITPTTPATITVNPGSTQGFCHYTVTGNDGTSTQTEGGWIVVGKPAATFAVSGGNNQSGSAGTALAQSLAVTLSSIPSGFSATGASVLFTTSAGTLSNGTTSGTSVIATTNSSGVASVTLTLPSSKGTVTVTAQDQFALGGATGTFSETAN
jgi:hypothetical protein